MKRISLKPKRKVSASTRAIRALAENVDRLVRVLTPTPIEEPKPAPMLDTNKPGHCRSCGWAVAPSHSGCARCSSVNLRVAPEWVTADVIAEQQALNPGKTWPTPFKRYNVQDAIHDFYGHHKN